MRDRRKDMRDRRPGTIGDKKRQDMIGERQEMKGKRQEKEDNFSSNRNL